MFLRRRRRRARRRRAVRAAPTSRRRTTCSGPGSCVHDRGQRRRPGDQLHGRRASSWSQALVEHRRALPDRHRRLPRPPGSRPGLRARRYREPPVDRHRRPRHHRLDRQRPPLRPPPSDVPDRPRRTSLRRRRPHSGPSASAGHGHRRARLRHRRPRPVLRSSCRPSSPSSSGWSRAAGPAPRPAPGDGRGRALAGWILGLIGILGFARGDHRIVAEQDGSSVLDDDDGLRLRPGGRRLRRPSDDDERPIEELPARDCDEPHDAEVYAVDDLTIDGDDYPGTERVANEAERICARRRVRGLRRQRRRELPLRLLLPVPERGVLGAGRPEYVCMVSASMAPRSPDPSRAAATDAGSSADSRAFSSVG